MTQFLPDAEQKMYDSIVHGLRSAGWSKSEAEAEAIDRIVSKRQRPDTITTEDLIHD